MIYYIIFDRSKVIESIDNPIYIKLKFSFIDFTI